MNHLLEIHLRELSRLLIPTSNGRAARIDGYALLNDRDTIHPLYAHEEQPSEQAGALDIYEPRIVYIRRVLESLLSIVDLEVDGKTVQPDGFRLKNLKQWLTPGGSATEILAHAASRCNLNCRFCYNKGAPSSLRPRPVEPEREYREIATRIAHYVPGTKLNLFPDMGSPGELLAHPHILEIMGALRRKTRELLRISSNGSTLTPPLIKALAEFQPLFLDISLNSVSVERRQWLMCDPNPHVALESLAYLKQARIPYSVVIVPWPFPSYEVMLEDLRQTATFAASHAPTLIQVSLPGYSRFFSKTEIFPHEEVWGKLKAAVQELRTAIDCPLVIRPGLFEEYTEPVQINTPRLIGVIKNSPAERAGLKPGDHILKINGIPVRNRPQARSLLSVIHQSDLTETSVFIQRNSHGIDLKLNLLDYGYPYAPETATHLGVVFPSSGIPQEWFETLRRVIVSRRAENVLLLSSFLVRPAVELFLRESQLLSGTRLHVRVPRNRYLGGNILMGDLMVVQDFIHAIKAFVKQRGARPDLVVIPSSPFHLSRWGRDLSGKEYLEIERNTEIPVALVECNPIFD